MIADTERIIDGFRGLPAGMDGSKEPSQIDSGAAWYATNVTFRGGNGPKTRPGFREIPSTYWRNPQPQKSCSISITSGVATVTTTTNHNYDSGDKVTIAGASPAGVNGTWTITVTAPTTFTFTTTQSGSVTGTITAVRDIDSAYGQDYYDSTTSRERYIANIRAAKYIQGVCVYQDPVKDNPTQMIVVADGKILSLNFNENSCDLLSFDDMSDDVPVFMVQAEKYLIIQTGQDEPRIFDGYAVRKAKDYGDNVVPTGRQMAYGQGRLFVAIKEGTEIAAGDLAFGGSTTNVGILGSSAANPTVVTTAVAHNFAAGDQVTISGHSSSPTINSTYAIGSVPSTTSFTIPVTVTSAGSGGFVSKFNAGQDRDILNFTETTFLNEGGTLTPSSKFGRITAMAFLPVQDTATGQGDLIVFCERGAVTFQVSAPREKWKSIEGFQRVLFDNIGSSSENILPVNGDLFFRSTDGNGLRTYRNARAEVGGYGQTPVSSEVDPILSQDTTWMLDRVSFAYFDNRLLMTCLPQQFPRRATGANYAAIETQAAQFAAEPVPTFFNGILAMDFTSLSAGRGKSAAVFDGVWTGLRVVSLVQGTFDKTPRCFAVCHHEDDTGRRVEVWEISTEDEFDTPVEGKRRINSSIVTKAFDFGDKMGMKKLIRCDLWFDDLGGGSDFPFECELFYRPDDYPNFTSWQKFERAFQTEFLLEDKNLQTLTGQQSAWAATNVSVLANQIEDPIFGRLEADKITENAVSGQFYINRGTTLTSGTTYTYSVYAKAGEREILALTLSGSAWSSSITGWFKLSDGGSLLSGTGRIQDLGDGWYRCSVTGTAANTANSNATIQLGVAGPQGSYQGIDNYGLFVWGSQIEAGDLPSEYDPDPPEIPNYERGYAPQVRFPAPPRTSNLATGVPAYLGHDFTLRVNWAGRARLGRLMLHGHRLIESVGGGTL